MRLLKTPRIETLNTVIAACLAVLAYAYGLFFTGGFDPHFAAVFILVAALAIMGLSQTAQHQSYLRDRALPVIALLWIFGIAATLTMAEIYEVALITSYVLLVFPLSLLAFIMLGTVPRQLAWCGLILLTAIGATGIWAVVQSLILNEGRAHSPLYNPNNMASLLNLGILPACALFVTARHKSLRILGALCAVVCLLGLIATQSRGGLLVAFASIVVFVVVFRRMGFLRGREAALLPALLGFALVAGFALYPDILSRFSHFFEAGQNDFTKRIERWHGAFDLLMASDRPVFGLGPGTFYQYFPPYRITGTDNASHYFAHMDPLQFTIEMGVIGTIIFYSPLLWLISAALRLRQVNIHDDGVSAQTQALARAGLITLLGLYAHAHISFPFYVMAILLSAAFVFALIYHALPARHDTPVLRLPPILRGIAIMMLLILAANAARIGMAQHYTQKAVTYSTSIDSPRFENALANAEFFAPHSFNEPRLLALHHKLATGSFPPVIEGKNPNKLLDTAQAYNPADARIPYMRARWLEQSDDQQHLTAHFLRRALDKDPGFFLARKRLIRKYSNDKRYRDAYKLVVQGGAHPHKTSQIQYLEKQAQFLRQKLVNSPKDVE